MVTGERWIPLQKWGALTKSVTKQIENLRQTPPGTLCSLPCPHHLWYRLSKGRQKSVKGNFAVAAVVSVASYALPDVLDLHGSEHGKSGSREQHFRGFRDILDFLDSYCCLCADKSHLFPSCHGCGCAGTEQVGGRWRTMLGAKLTERFKKRISQVSWF